jgi:hypothetical protein
MRRYEAIIRADIEVCPDLARTVPTVLKYFILIFTKVF